MSVFLECPLCEWREESEVSRYAEGNRAAAPGIAAALGMPTDALLSIHGHQAARRDEHTLERHLLKHGPHDWLPALMDARRAAEDVTDRG